MQKSSKILCAALAALLATGATVPVQAQSQAPAGCRNTAAAAIVGGLLGALVKSKHRGEGAIIGAALGAVACMVVQASSQQTSTADAAYADYQARNSGQAPTTVMLDDYRSEAPASTQREREVQVASRGTLVVPPELRGSQFSEVLTLQVPGEAKPVVNQKRLDVHGGGGFAGDFRIGLSKDFPQGTYRYRTQVMDGNNTVLGEQVGQFQVI